MDSNISFISNHDPSLFVNSQMANIFNICIGILLTGANCLLFVTIIVHKALRNHKEYSLLAVLLFFNALVGFGFLSAGKL
jgi:hypothetical protein